MSNLQKMIDNSGIYIVSAFTDVNDKARVVVVSQNGILRAMDLGQVLRPDGWNGDPKIFHGPLK